MTVAEARVTLVQAIEAVVADPARGSLWAKVEKGIDFFENTVDAESFKQGVRLGQRGRGALT